MFMRHAVLATLLSAAMFSVAAKEVVAPTAEAAVAPDPRIKRQLEELEYKYEIDQDGDYKLVFDVSDSPDKRSQLVYVRSPVESFGEHQVREVWSPGYRFRKGENFPAAVANRLLEATQDSKLGAWAKQNDYAVFVVKLPADASTKSLSDAIEATIRSADEMEAELTNGKDEF